MAGYDFEHLLGLARNPGDDGAPETIYDDLGAAYNDRVSSADAKISELSSSLSEKDSELQRVKAHNYELLTAVQVGNPVDPKGDLDKANETDGDEYVTSLSDIISYD
jgi:hypothetical protein